MLLVIVFLFSIMGFVCSVMLIVIVFHNVIMIHFRLDLHVLFNNKSRKKYLHLMQWSRHYDLMAT